MGVRGAPSIPVVDRATGHLLGLVSRAHVLALYEQAVAGGATGEHPDGVSSRAPPRVAFRHARTDPRRVLPLAPQGRAGARPTTSTAQRTCSRTRRCARSSTARWIRRCATSTSTSAPPAQLDADSLFALCTTLPMMAERRVVVLREVEALKRKPKVRAALARVPRPARARHGAGADPGRHRGERGQGHRPGGGRGGVRAAAGGPGAQVARPPGQGARRGAAGRRGAPPGARGGRRARLARGGAGEARGASRRASRSPSSGWASWWACGMARPIFDWRDAVLERSVRARGPPARARCSISRASPA